MNLNEDLESDENLVNSQEWPTRKPLKRKTLVSPWINVEEFHKVYDWLFSEKSSIESKKLALREMIIWKIRRGSLTPVAILSTIVILETELKDEENLYKTERDIQIAYAHSFTCFLNFMSSTIQTNRQKTMYEMAKELGLESIIVDLRHMCAHGHVMPPLEILRKYSHYCFKWLRDTYWTPQRCSMVNVDAKNIRKWDVTKFDEKITLKYQLYDSAMQCYLKGAKTIKLAKKYLHGKRFTRLKIYYESISAKSLKFVMQNLVKELSVCIRKNEKSIRDSESIFTEAFLKAEYFLKVAGKHTKKDHEKIRVLKVTNELFKMLASHDLIEDLYRGLLVIVENSSESNDRRKGASFWANELVKGFVAFRKIRAAYKNQIDTNPDMKCNLNKLNKTILPIEVKNLLDKANIDIRRTLIFGCSVRSPRLWLYDRNYILRRLKLMNEYSIEIVKNLLDLVHPALLKNEVVTIRKLINIQFEINLDEGDKKINHQIHEDRLYTVDDLNFEKSDNSDNEMSDDDDQNYGIWSKVPDWQDWSSTPIGKLPWDTS